MTFSHLLIDPMSTLNDQEFLKNLCYVIIALSAPTIVYLSHKPAQYGKHSLTSTTAGFSNKVSESDLSTLGGVIQSLINIKINAKIAWFIFESPNLLWAATCCWMQQQEYHESSLIVEVNSDGKHMPARKINLFLILLFVVHYIHRAVIYPLNMSSMSHPMTIYVLVIATIFTNING